MERSFFVEPEALATLAQEFDSAWNEVASRITFSSNAARDASRREFARVLIGLYRQTPKQGPVVDTAVALFLCMYPNGLMPPCGSAHAAGLHDPTASKAF